MQKTGLRSRVLAMLLCFLMVFTSIPTDAFAAETTINGTQETNEFSVPEIVEDEKNDETEFDDLQIEEIIEDQELDLAIEEMIAPVSDNENNLVSIESITPINTGSETTGAHGYIKNIYFKNTGSTGTYDFTFDPDTTEYDLYLEEGSKGNSITMYIEFSDTNTDIYCKGFKNQNAMKAEGSQYTSIVTKVTKVKLNSPGTWTFQVGPQDENSQFIAEKTDTYTLNLYRKPALKSLSIKDSSGETEYSLKETVGNYIHTYSVTIPSGQDTIKLYPAQQGTDAKTSFYVGDTQYTDVTNGVEVDLSKYTADESGIKSIPFSYRYASDAHPAQTDYTLKVMEKNLTPVIATQPQNISCGMDEEKQLSVVAHAPEGYEDSQLSYQWLKQRTSILYDEIEGATSSTYTVPTNLPGSDSYACRVTLTVNGTAYQVQSETVSVDVKLTKMITPDMTIVSNAKFEGKIGTTPDFAQIRMPIYKDIHGRKQEPAEYKVYQVAAPNVDAEAKLVDDTGFEWIGNDGGDEAHLYLVHIPTQYEKGTYYYYVEAKYVVYENGEIDTTITPITVKSGIITHTFESYTGIQLDGSGTPADPYLIKEYKDLIYIRDELIHKGQNMWGVNFKLTTDITLPKDWTPIGYYKDDTIKNSTGSVDAQNGKNVNAFMGTLDGVGHTVTIAEDGLPLFRFVSDAVVKNLNIYGTRIASAGLVTDILINYGPDGDYNTGCPGMITCDNVTLKSGSRTYGSGLVNGSGSGSNAIVIKNCTVEKDVIIGYSGDNTAALGSFVGDFNGSIVNCVSYATVKGAAAVGGIAGKKGQSMGNCSIKNCKFYGSVETTGNRAGGILGAGYFADSAPNTMCVVIESCTCYGTVAGKDQVGGILGAEAAIQCWSNGVGSIRNNSFEGTITSSGTSVGGVIGYMASLNRYTIVENNYYPKTCPFDGIGKVKYIDTNCATHETASGTIYFDTSKGKPGISGVSITDLNREDDPLGADKSKLCRTDKATEKYVTELLISGDFKKEYQVGDKFDSTGMKFEAKWSDGSTTYPTLTEITFSGFDSENTGLKGVTAKYKDASCVIQITVKPKSGNITVTLSILGDQAHDSDSDGKVHTLTGGNLTTWVAAKAYTIDSNTTAWGLIKSVLDENKMTYSNPTENYIEWITKDGEKLDQKANGVNSGWMFTVNGVHGNLGVSEQYMEEGDVLILHYTDDYTQEKDDVAAMTAEEVIALIDQIPETITLDCKEKIEAARAAYTKLEASERSKVTNYQTLLDAEKALNALQQNTANIKNVYQVTGNYLEKLGTPDVGSIGGEWMVLGLARSGKKVPAGYFDNVVSYVKKNIDSNGRLHTAKSTDNSRLILALTAAGYDPRNVGGYNLVTALSDMDYVEKQGINGSIWALIALNSHSYATLSSGTTTRTGLVKKILNAQLADGGWALSGSTADSDMTGMALQALAPYYDSNETVKAAVDKALTKLSSMQEDNGSFATSGTITSESTAQVIVALSALGIDADTDSRFIKNGFSVVDALLSFAVDGGGFRHIVGGNRDGMATEQGYYALTAYMRMKEGKTSLYDMSDVNLKIGTVTDDTDHSGNNGSEDKDQVAAKKVEALIDTIDMVTVNFGSQLRAIRAAYDKLTASQKKLVSNYAKLTKAEETYGKLKAGQVEELIAAIGKVTLDSKDKINAARAAYRKLAAAYKAKVSNLAVLEAAEEEYQALLTASKKKTSSKKTDTIVKTEEETSSVVQEDPTEELLTDSVYTDAATGISISGVTWNVQLVVEEITDQAKLESIKSSLNGNALLKGYHIELLDLLIGEAYEPTEAVLVKLPLELLGDYSSYDGLAVVHYTEDGTVEYLDCTLIGDCISFYAAELSDYAVVGYEGISPMEHLTADTAAEASEGTEWLPWTVAGCFGIALLAVLLLQAKKSKKNER